MKNYIIVILSILVLGMGIYIAYDKLSVKEEINNTEISKETDNNNILDSLVGEWGRCKDNSCYGVIVSKKDNDEYSYIPYLMWSDGSMAGVVKEINKIDNNKYKLTVYYEAYDGVLSSYPEQTNEYSLDISELLQDIVYIDNNQYKKITGDRETFFNELINR